MAAVTVYSAPDDGRKGRPKNLEHTNSAMKQYSAQPNLEIYTGFTPSQLMTNISG